MDRDSDIDFSSKDGTKTLAQEIQFQSEFSDTLVENEDNPVEKPWADDWEVIETDGFLLTNLIHHLNVDGVEIEDVISFSDDYIKRTKAFHGLIIFMKEKPTNTTDENITENFRYDNIYFAPQIDTNLCATQAIVSVLLNCTHEDFTLGPTLTKLKVYSQKIHSKEVGKFTPHMKSIALSKFTTIRDVHNSFVKKPTDTFVLSNDKQDEYHFYFITYIPFQGRICELDCLNKNPIDRGAIPQDTEWIYAAVPIVQQRLQELKGNSMRLMAIISDPVKKDERELEQVLAASTLPADELDDKANYLNRLIPEEKRNKELYRIENLRRRHNWLPFIIELLKAYAAHGSLASTVEKAIAAEEAQNKRETD